MANDPTGTCDPQLPAWLGGTRLSAASLPGDSLNASKPIIQTPPV